jgi:hypothetical protein
MNFFPSRLMMVAALATLALGAPAQQTIIFSKPADLPANPASASLPDGEGRAGDYNAPHPLFKDYTPDFPLPKPLFQNNHNASVQEALDKRKNWTLLTPEQILGIQTPEQILGGPGKNRDKKLSLEEQFLLRERRASARSATNGRAGNPALLRALTDGNPFEAKNKNDENNPFGREPQKMEPGTRYFNQLLNAQDSAGNGPEEKPSSPWNNPFTQPSRPKETPEQLADRERFRALMEPTTPPDKVEVPTRFSAVKASVPDPFLQPVPVVNPAGRAVPPLENIFSRPAGIKPLPGVSTPPPTPVAAKPNWQSQLPPWMRDGPPSHTP